MQAVQDSRSTAGRNEARIDALTSLRFLAALAIFAYHARSQFSLRSPGIKGGIVDQALGLGFLGVPFFFVLSGFILTVVYVQRSSIQHGRWVPGSRRAFFLARIARVYPVYLLGLALTIPSFMGSSRGSEPWAVAAAAAFTPTLLQAWVPPIALAWNAPGWSLSVEAFFYLAFPALLVQLSTLSPRTRVCLFAASVVAAALATHGLMILSPDLGKAGGFGSPPPELHNLARYFPLMHLPAFLCGMISGMAYLDTRCPSSPDAPLRRSTLVTHGGIIVATGVIGIALGGRMPHIIFHNWLFLPAFRSLILVAAIPNDRLTVLRWRPCVLLGEASYSFYILDLISIRIYLKVVSTLVGGEAVGWLHAILCCMVTIGVSILVFSFFEAPMRVFLCSRLTKIRFPHSARPVGA